MGKLYDSEPKRTIGVRLKTQDLSPEVLEALVFTHKVVNQGIFQWENQLLETRQGDTLLTKVDAQGNVGEELVEGAVWQAAAIRRHGVDDPDILKSLQQEYGMTIRTYDKKRKGGIQEALGELGALYQEGSHCGEKKLEVLNHFGWLPAASKSKKEVKKGEPRVPETARAQIDSYLKAHPDAAKSQGHPTRWHKLYRAKRDGTSMEGDMYEALLDDVERKLDLKAADPKIDLRARGMLPLFKPVLSVQTSPQLWELTCFSSAAQNLLSYEQKRNDMIDAYDALVTKIATKEAKGASFLDLLQPVLEKYPKLNFAEIRGWKKRGLYRWLRNHPNKTDSQRKQYVKDRIQKSPKNYGSSEILCFLAQKELQPLIEHEDGDAISWLAGLNKLKYQLENKRRAPRLTLASGNQHVEYDAPHGNNKPSYEVYQKDGGSALYVKLPLLYEKEDGSLGMRRHELRCLPTRQMREPVLSTAPHKSATNASYVTYVPQDRVEPCTRLFGGAKLLLEGDLSKGPKKGRAFLYFSFASHLEEAPLKQTASARAYLSSSLNKRAKKEPPPDGFRLLSFDLNVANNSGSFSIFEKVDGVFKHKGTSLIRLPGDKPTPHEQALRDREMARAFKILNEVKDLRWLGKLARLPDDEWAAKSPKMLEKLHTKCDSLSSPSEAKKVFLERELVVGKKIKLFRRNRLSIGGKSFWRVLYLDLQEVIIKKWDRHSRPDAGTEKDYRTLRTGTAKRLRKHKNALVQDRVRTTASWLVQAARGRKYVNGCWAQKYAPVDLIILDGLKNYRPDRLRPRGENRQLRNWSQREICSRVQQQAEVAGILTTECSTAYSSKFSYKTRAPGVRCHALNKQDLAAIMDFETSSRMRDTLLENGYTLENLRPGDVVIPPKGMAGELFVTLTPDDRFISLNADQNASRNNAIQYLEGYAAFPSMSGTLLKDGRFVLECDGARMKSAFQAVAVIFRSIGEDMWVEDCRFHRSDLLLKHLDDTCIRGERGTLLRDLSGTFFDPEVWVASPRFWGQVEKVINKRLREQVSRDETPVAARFSLETRGCSYERLF
jgi:hypothetical protein